MFGLEILKSRLKDAPKTSGVYLFKNKKDIPIYIGKAINIKRRLSNYGNLPKLPRRLQKMVSQTVNIDFELTESERNALLLEALLIKKFSPRYNIRLKDDKSFPLIKITNGKVQFAGVGGKKMASAGLRSLFPMNDISVMGFIEILPRLPRLIRRIKDVRNDIKKKKPTCVITIDSPEFNFRISKNIKAKIRTNDFLASIFLIKGIKFSIFSFGYF